MAEQFTLVTPIGNVDPEAGRQVVVGSGESSSITVGGVYDTVAPSGLVAFTPVMFPGTLVNARSWSVAAAGVIAIPSGLMPTVIGVPGVFVATSIGVTVSLLMLVT